MTSGDTSPGKMEGHASSDVDAEIDVIVGDVTVRVGAGVEAAALRRVLSVVRTLP